MNSKIILEYLRTIALSLLVAFILVIVLLVFAQHQVITEYQDIQKQENINAKNYAQISDNIAKYQGLIAEDPQNFKINLKLGELYESKKDYKNSEKEYKIAMKKAPFAEYRPTYELAILYINQNRLEEAQALFDVIEERPDKKLIKYKTDIYNKLGDKYYNKANYEQATYRYQKALFYATTIKSIQEKKIKSGLASSYVYLADKLVDQHEIDQAINYLKQALSLYNAPIIKYKLAVLLTKDSPNLAYQYFDEVFRAAPEIINYDVYNAFLTSMVQEANDRGEYAQAELYEYKMKKLKEYSSINIISIEDLYLDYAKGLIALNKWHTKYDINFECQFKNISNNDINSLYLQVDFKTKDKILYVYKQQIFDENSILKAHTTSPPIIINTSIDRTNEYQMPKDLIAQIYVSKSDSSYKILLKEIKINEKIKRRIEFRLFGLKFSLPLPL